MKAIKIFNMKKNLMLVLLFNLLFLTGCSWKEIFSFSVVPMTDGILLTYDQEIKEYLAYTDIELPSYKIEFQGTLNITENRQGEFECIFAKNDDFTVSRLIQGIIEEYSGKNRVVFNEISVDDEMETWMNLRNETKDEKIYLQVKDGKIYNEHAYIILENGLRLTMNYARFTDKDNNVYYRWQKTESIRLVLHYPLMVIKQGEEKKFVFLALPNAVFTKFDTTTKTIKDLLSKDKFLEAEWYTYEYVNSYEEDYQNYLNYYIDNFNGRYINDDFVYTYLGYDFKVVFNESNFIISLYN